MCTLSIWLCRHQGPFNFKNTKRIRLFFSIFLMSSQLIICWSGMRACIIDIAPYIVRTYTLYCGCLVVTIHVHLFWTFQLIFHLLKKQNNGQCVAKTNTKVTCMKCVYALSHILIGTNISLLSFAILLSFSFLFLLGREYVKSDKLRIT